MKKITELTEIRWKTVHYKDAYGNRQREQEEYLANRLVRTVAPGPRFGHFIIDLIAFQIVIYLIEYALAMLLVLSNFSIILNLSVSLISLILLLLIYPTLYATCEMIWQKTPGKFLTKTIVIDEYGNKPEALAIILRSLIRVVPFEAFSCLGDKYNRSHAWHDRWSNTWVVTEDELVILKKLQAEQSDVNFKDSDLFDK